MNEDPQQGATGVPAALSIVTLGVADLARAERFYSALGWRRAASSVDGVIAWFDLGGAWLGVFPDGELAADSGLTDGPVAGSGDAGSGDAGSGDAGSGSTPPAGGMRWRGATYAVNLGSVEAVDAALEVARRAGARVTLEPVTTDYGVHHACFADPDGHVWEVAHNPAFPQVDGRTLIP